MPMITAVISAIADVIDLRDRSLLSLEVSTFVRKFPDISLELLSSLIQIREDIGRSDAKTIAEDALNHARFHPRGDQEVLKLFELAKPGSGGGVGNALGRRALPALEMTMQTMFATLVSTTKNTSNTK